MPFPACPSDLMASLLADGVPVRFRALGASMEPAIPGGGEVTVEPLEPAERIVRGAVVLARVGGRLLLHRVVDAEGDRVLLRGDALRVADPPVPRGDILGIVRSARAPGSARRLRFALRALWEGWTTPTTPALERRLATHLARAAAIRGAVPEWDGGWGRTLAGDLPEGAEVLVLGPGSPPPAGVGPFDAVVLPAYALLPRAARRIALLSALAATLRPGGTLALRPLPHRRGRSRREALLEAGRALFPLVWERGDRLAPYAAGTGVGEDWIFFHLFAEGEAEREMARAGFPSVTGKGGWLLAKA